MEWEGAKRFVIVLLVVLNAILAGLNISQGQKNTMTAAQEKAIFEVLSQNGITMYTNLKTDKDPMYRFEANVPSYAKEDLEATIFDGEKTRVSLGTQILYKTDTKTLVLEGDRGTFTDATIQRGLGELVREDAIEIAEQNMEKMKDLFGDYKLNYVSEGEDGWVVEFCSTLQEEVIFSNEVTFFVSNMGVYQIDFTYCEITGTSEQKKEICFVDEALMTFMREWKTRNGEASHATVQRIELGYDLMEQGNVVAGTSLYLEPCYRIYTMEEKEPYLVNAYTCQIVKKGV
ncbi:MAG: two-component system regulatory protein YycI [Anaerotignum sp.]